MKQKQTEFAQWRRRRASPACNSPNNRPHMQQSASIYSHTLTYHCIVINTRFIMKDSSNILPALLGLCICRADHSFPGGAWADGALRLEQRQVSERGECGDGLVAQPLRLTLHHLRRHHLHSGRRALLRLGGQLPLTREHLLHQRLRRQRRHLRCGLRYMWWERSILHTHEYYCRKIAKRDEQHDDLRYLSEERRASIWTKGLRAESGRGLPER